VKESGGRVSSLDRARCGSAGTDGRWQIRSDVAKDRAISTVDHPDERHAHETVDRRRGGFQAHVGVEPDAGIITSVNASAMIVSSSAVTLLCR